MLRPLAKQFLALGKYHSEDSDVSFMLSWPSLFRVFFALFAAVWIFLVFRGITKEFKSGDRANWIKGGMGLLILIGAGGFFAAGLAANGILKVPKSFEWPVGYANDVVTMPGGNRIVPLVPSGRVQIYDSQWHFIRGWQVDAEGGDFKVGFTPEGVIEVFTARGGHYYSFTQKGDLISAKILTQQFDSLPQTGQWVLVPTSPLLWVFSSPFLSWGVMVVGMAGIAIVKKLERDKRDGGQRRV